MNLGKKIKEIRTTKKISLRKLAELSNVSKSTIIEIESDTGGRNPTQNTLSKLAKALQVPLEDFFKSEPITENEHNKEIINNEGIRRIERARNKMPLKEKEKMMKILKASFEDYFDEED